MFNPKPPQAAVAVPASVAEAAVVFPKKVEPKITAEAAAAVDADNTLEGKSGYCCAHCILV